MSLYYVYINIIVYKLYKVTNFKNGRSVLLSTNKWDNTRSVGICFHVFSG